MSRDRRTGMGVLAGLLTLVVVAVPAFWSIVLAVASFSGCFIECSSPEPAVGAVWAGVAILLLALPIVAGMAIARVPLRRGWPWFVGASVLLAAAAVQAQRVL